LPIPTRNFLKKALSFWEKKGRIEQRNHGIRLRQPFIHMPKRESWQKIRDLQFKRGLQSLQKSMSVRHLTTGVTHRTLMHRFLTPQQKERWLEQLARVEMDFAQTPFKSDAQSENNMLVILLGPRPFKFN